ncbi:MAG: hypothetical protein Q8O95_04430 [bacterium]|nr:hypothetical protein [bacterium]
MAVARLSLSIPTELHEYFLKLVKRKNANKSEVFSALIEAEKKREEGLRLQEQYNRLAGDEEFQKESTELVKLNSNNYADNILPNDPY